MPSATLLLAFAALTGCASQGMPPGGPTDTAPPTLVKVTPDSGSLGVSPRAVTFRYTFPANLPDGWSMGQGIERARDIGFKTGTSYGYRDAWAMGISRHFTVGVWVGRADVSER